MNKENSKRINIKLIVIITVIAMVASTALVLLLGKTSKKTLDFSKITIKPGSFMENVYSGKHSIYKNEINNCFEIDMGKEFECFTKTVDVSKVNPAFADKYSEKNNIGAAFVNSLYLKYCKDYSKDFFENGKSYKIKIVSSMSKEDIKIVEELFNVKIKNLDKERSVKVKGLLESYGPGSGAKVLEEKADIIKSLDEYVQHEYKKKNDREKKYDIHYTVEPSSYYFCQFEDDNGGYIEGIYHVKRVDYGEADDSYVVYSTYVEPTTEECAANYEYCHNETESECTADIDERYDSIEKMK